jgi:hypothetical protein
MRAIAGDKKSKRGRVLYTLISAPGRAVIGVDVPDRIVTAILSGRSLGNRG